MTFVDVLILAWHSCSVPNLSTIMILREDDHLGSLLWNCRKDKPPCCGFLETRHRRADGAREIRPTFMLGGPDELPLK
jgi:hypothetical protein